MNRVKKAIKKLRVSRHEVIETRRKEAILVEGVTQKAAKEATSVIILTLNIIVIIVNTEKNPSTIIHIITIMMIITSDYYSFTLILPILYLKDIC